MATPFTQGQRKFIDDLHRRTGLDRRVIGSWVLSEMNGGAARSREAERNYNWLNIAYYDTGPGGITKSGVWRNPSSAAAATADFLKGKRFGPSPGIRKIIKYAGKSPDEQINAIANSGWASSGYDGGSTLRSVYGRLDWMGKGTTPAATTSARPASTAAAAAPSSAAPVRRQLAAQWLLSKSKNPNDLLYQIQQAGASADPAVPASTPTTVRQKAPTTVRQAPAAAPSNALHPGSPVPHQGPRAATHPTAGLPNFPAYDYMAPAGTAAVAPVSGTVVKVSGSDPKGGPSNGPHGPFGLSVYIRGRDGRTYYLTHMGSRTVKVGQRVGQGQRIGSVGNYAKWGGADHIHMGVSG